MKRWVLLAGVMILALAMAVPASALDCDEEIWLPFCVTLIVSQEVDETTGAEGFIAWFDVIPDTDNYKGSDGVPLSSTGHPELTPLFGNSELPQSTWVDPYATNASGNPYMNPSIELLAEALCCGPLWILKKGRCLPDGTTAYSFTQYAVGRRHPGNKWGPDYCCPTNCTEPYPFSIQ